MKHTERIAPLAAVATAATTLACCLPVTIAAAAATASISTIAARYRAWLIGASAMLLVAGFMQMARAKRTCGRRSRVDAMVFWISVAVVLLIALFPQVVASVLADWLV